MAKLIQCKTCNAEIATNAKNCPACGAKNKKPIYKKWWVWVIVVVVALSAAGQGSKSNAETPVSTAKSDQSNLSNSSAEASSASEPVKAESIISEAGQSITTKNFVVTLEEFNALEGGQFNQPADGKEFVELVLKVENISQKEYNVSSIIMFDAYEDGFAINESLSAHIANDVSTMDGTLGAGKKMRGKLAYELSNDWKELEVDIDLTALSLSTDGKIKILLENK